MVLTPETSGIKITKSLVPNFTKLQFTKRVVLGFELKQEMCARWTDKLCFGLNWGFARPVATTDFTLACLNVYRNTGLNVSLKLFNLKFSSLKFFHVTRMSV